MSKDTELMRLIRKISFDHELEPDDVIKAFEESIQMAVNNKFVKYKNVKAYIDREEGIVRVYVPKKVVKRLKDPDTEVLITKLDEPEKYKSGDIVEVEIDPSLLDRIAAQSMKNILPKKLEEIKKRKLLEDFHKKIGQIIQGEIERYDKNNYYVRLGKIRGIIPKTDFPPNHIPRIGEKYYFLIVRILENVKGGPFVILSRSRPEFIIQLFAREVPEIREGIVEIKAVARDMGKRSKIAVYSNDPNVDPVGACVGVAGKRIQQVVKELRGEKIDVVIWSDNLLEFIKNTLKPAEVLFIELDQENNQVFVIVKDDSLSIAIGRRGQNAKLCAKLVGYKIDIKGESEFKKIYERKAKELKNYLKSLNMLSEEEIENFIKKVTYKIEDLQEMLPEDIMEKIDISHEKAEKILKMAKKVLNK